MGPNTKQWQENSDDWVKTMTEAKENKKLYQKYASRRNNPMPYVKWLKGKKKGGKEGKRSSWGKGKRKKERPTPMPSELKGMDSKYNGEADLSRIQHAEML